MYLVKLDLLAAAGGELNIPEPLNTTRPACAALPCLAPDHFCVLFVLFVSVELKTQTGSRYLPFQSHKSPRLLERSVK